MPAVRLTPSLREKVWGKTRLTPWFEDSPVAIGEVLYLTGRELPLLVKLIFTAERLSIQVHPDDGDDVLSGKTEMWHILEAKPGAAIAMGFREPITRERLWEATRTGEVEKLVNWVPVKAGETYFVPAHTVHAIGEGIVLCEIQQNSDITYRLWDYGRPRETHAAKAVPLSDLGVHPGAAHGRPVSGGRMELVRSKHFVTESLRLKAGDSFAPQAENCQLWICISGAGSVEAEPVRAGEVWLLPEEGEQPEIRAAVDSQFLRTWIPRS